MLLWLGCLSSPCLAFQLLFHPSVWWGTRQRSSSRADEWVGGWVGGWVEEEEEEEKTKKRRIEGVFLCGFLFLLAAVLHCWVGGLIL